MPLKHELLLLIVLILVSSVSTIAWNAVLNGSVQFRVLQDLVMVAIGMTWYAFVRRGYSP